MPILISRKGRLFWSALASITLADAWTKYVAHTRLVGDQFPREILGDTVRLMLVYNPGAAFGLHVGSYSRWVFPLLAVAALGVLGAMYRATPPHDRLRILALGLICGGAVGKLLNRTWSARGVVDFIDIGIGQWRWPTFNIADIGVSVGAILLAWMLRREGRTTSGDQSAGRTSSAPT